MTYCKYEKNYFSSMEMSRFYCAPGKNEICLTIFHRRYM